MSKRARTLILALVVSASPLYAQQGPPDGFADVAWGSNEVGLVDEFGENPTRDVHRLTWNGLLLLGENANVSAWVHPDVGLMRGVYAFEFTGMRDEDALFEQCNETLEKIKDILYGRYGDGTPNGKTGCDDGFYESWKWTDVTVEIMTTYNSQAVGIGVMYRNHDLESKSADADRRRF